jgi:G3E family GTPase
MIMDAQFDREWQVNEERKNQLVLIGRDLDEAKLRASFNNCLS